MTLNLAYVACSTEFQKRFEMSLQKFTVLCCHRPMNHSLVTTIHLQFAFPAQFWTPEPVLPHGLPMQNSSYPVSDWGGEQYETPVSNTNHHNFGTNTQYWRRKQNVLHAWNDSQCTADCPQWTGKIFENECRGFIGVPGKW